MPKEHSRLPRLCSSSGNIHFLFPPEFRPPDAGAGPFVVAKAAEKTGGPYTLELMRCLWIALNAVEHQIFEVLLEEAYNYEADQLTLVSSAAPPWLEGEDRIFLPDKKQNGGLGLGAGNTGGCLSRCPPDHQRRADSFAAASDLFRHPILEHKCWAAKEPSSVTAHFT